MLKERIAWLVALVVVGIAAYTGGQQIGFTSGQQNQIQSAQQFFGQRGAGGAGFAGQGGGRGANLAGTVEKVDGTTITIKRQDGSNATITLANDGQIRHTVTGTMADIKVGERIIAFGQSQAEPFQASIIQVGATGPGGAGGRQPPANP